MYVYLTLKELATVFRRMDEHGFDRLMCWSSVRLGNQSSVPIPVCTKSTIPKKFEPSAMESLECVCFACFVRLATESTKEGYSNHKDSNLVDPASSHTLVSKIKPCMSKYKPLYGETANGSLYQL